MYAVLTMDGLFGGKRYARNAELNGTGNTIMACRGTKRNLIEERKIMEKTENIITELIMSTERQGFGSLLTYMKRAGFFEAPASSRFHGSYEGGLAKHSLDVYNLLLELSKGLKLDEKATYGQMPMKLKPENLIIAGLLHDLCKIGAYQKTKKGDGFTNNRDKEKGHAKLSLTRIQKYIKLDKLEVMMIRYHMGMYGLFEFQDKEGDPNGEYPLRGDHSKDESLTKEESQKRRYGNSLANATFHNPIVKLMSICDEIATMREKAKDD